MAHFREAADRIVSMLGFCTAVWFLGNGITTVDPAALHKSLEEHKDKCDTALAEHFVHLSQELHFLAFLTLITGMLVGFVLLFVNPAAREAERLREKETRQVLHAEREVADADLAHGRALEVASDAAASASALRAKHDAAAEEERVSAALAKEITEAAKIKVTAAAQIAKTAAEKAEIAEKAELAAAAAAQAATKKASDATTNTAAINADQLAASPALPADQDSEKATKNALDAQAAYHVAKVASHAATKEAADAAIEAKSKADELASAIDAEQLAASTAAAAVLLLNTESLRAAADANDKADTALFTKNAADVARKHLEDIIPPVGVARFSKVRRRILRWILFFAVAFSLWSCVLAMFTFMDIIRFKLGCLWMKPDIYAWVVIVDIFFVGVILVRHGFLAYFALWLD